MRNSSLAERLEEFAATVRVIDPPAKKSPVDHGEAANSERQAPRRLTLTTRSRQRPVTGMRQFRVF